MADQVLRDTRGYIIGKIATDNRGVQTIRDARGYKKGTFDPRDNKTRDERGYVVGSGNLLTTLL